MHCGESTLLDNYIMLTFNMLLLKSQISFKNTNENCTPILKLMSLKNNLSITF